MRKKYSSLQWQYIAMLVALMLAVYGFIVFTYSMNKAKYHLLSFQNQLAEVMDGWHYLLKHIYGMLISDQDPESVLREGQALIGSYSTKLVAFENSVNNLEIGNIELKETAGYLVAGLKFSISFLEKPMRLLDEFITKRRTDGEGILFPNSMYLVFRELDSGIMEPYDALLLYWMRDSVREIGYAYADMMELRQQTILDSLNNQLEAIGQRNDRVNTVLLGMIIVAVLLFGWRLFMIGGLLVKRVDERTAELDSALKNLSATQDQLIRSQTLTTVGNLSAGIAHELNTPLAAIKSSVSFLMKEISDIGLPFLASLLRLPEGEDPATLLTELIGQAAELGESHDRQAVKSLKSLWQSKGLRTDGQLFDLLSSESLYSLGERLATWPPDAQREAILWLVISLSRSTSIIGLATEKASAVVTALRGQLAGTKELPAEPVNIVSSLEQALTLHQTWLKHGIAVRRNFPELVYVMDHGNQLAQVWVNLISNAVQAMDDSGQLELSVQREDNLCHVSVADNGSGIPAHIRNQIFTPYVTTKAAGMGLGLNICKRIVEDHQGWISFESQPGRTVFVVTLPVCDPGLPPSQFKAS